LELYDVLWETATGGRFFLVYHGGAPRKYLFDLDRDSVIELEMWDPDSDGQFEASRPAHMPIPEFLMPPRRPVVAVAAAATDSTRRDSISGVAPRVDSTRAQVQAAPPAATMQYPREVF